MDLSDLNTKDLLSRVAKFEDQLLKRYKNMIALAGIPTRTIGSEETGDEKEIPDRDQAALNALKMEMETTALIRTANDILTMSRQFKELWLFGQLNTLGEDESMEKKMDEDRGAVGAMIEKLLGQAGKQEIELEQ